MDSIQQQPKKKNGWNPFNGCLFSYRDNTDKNNEQQTDATRCLKSSINFKSINSETNSNQSSKTSNIYNTNVLLGINNQSEKTNNDNAKNNSKTQKNQFPNNQMDDLKEEREFNENTNNSFQTSGLNTPISGLYNFKNYEGQGIDKKGGNGGQGEKDKLFACSLDANNMEHLQKMIEKKQVKDQLLQQQIDQQVKQKFPIQKIFFLRDQKNKYNTLAYCTQQHFYINVGNFNNSVISNSTRNNANLLNNGSHLFKNNANVNTSKINVSQDSNTSQNPNLSNLNQSKNLNNTVDFLNYQNLYAKFKTDTTYQDNFTPQKIALHIAQSFKKYPLLIDACCGAGGNTIQFSKFNKMVIAVDKSSKALRQCVENLKNHRQEKSVNVEFICADFLNLECGELGQLRADLVFINPQIDTPTDQTKPDIFNQSSPNLLKALKNGYRMSKNVAILLPYYIDINQIPILMDRFYRSLPLQNIFLTFIQQKYQCIHSFLKNKSDIIQHHCPHIELIYMNGRIKYFLIMIGDVSKFCSINIYEIQNFQNVFYFDKLCENHINRDDEIKFLQEYIRDNSYYKGPYEDKIYELLQSIANKVGVKKLVSSLIKSIDLNDLQKQKNLLNTFIDELLKDKIIQDKEIKQILNINQNMQVNVCDSLSDQRDSQNFVYSLTSQHSNFELEMQYGSNKQSQEFENQSAGLTNIVRQHSFDKESQHNSGIYQVVESSLGDQLDNNMDFDDTEENNSEIDDYNENQSNESDFYIDEHNNIPFDGQKVNVNNQINTL